MQMLQLYFEIIKCKLFSLRIHNQFITLALSVYLKISVTRMQPGYYLLQVLLILSWKRWVMCFFMNRVKYTKWINMPGLHFLHISVTLCYQFQSGGASVEIEFTATSSANSTDGIAAWKRRGEFILISLQPNNNTIFKEDTLTGPPPHSILNSLKIILRIKNATKNLPLPYILSTLKVRNARKLRKIPIVSEIVRLIDVYLLKMVKCVFRNDLFADKGGFLDTDREVVF